MTTTTTVHDERAREIARGIESVATATQSLRQGDVIMERLGDHDPDAQYRDTGPYGLVVMRGNHGEHRLIGEAIADDTDVVSLARTSILVHTDVPLGRHDPFRLVPGRWTIRRQRELDAAGSVAQVMD